MVSLQTVTNSQLELTHSSFVGVFSCGGRLQVCGVGYPHLTVFSVYYHLLPHPCLHLVFFHVISHHQRQRVVMVLSSHLASAYHPFWHAHRLPDQLG